MPVYTLYSMPVIHALISSDNHSLLAPSMLEDAGGVMLDTYRSTSSRQIKEVHSNDSATGSEGKTQGGVARVVNSRACFLFFPCNHIINIK